MIFGVSVAIICSQVRLTISSAASGMDTSIICSLVRSTISLQDLWFGQVDLLLPGALDGFFRGLRPGHVDNQHGALDDFFNKLQPRDVNKHGDLVLRPGGRSASPPAVLDMHEPCTADVPHSCQYHILICAKTTLRRTFIISPASKSFTVENTSIVRIGR